MYLCKTIVLICELTFMVISLVEIEAVPRLGMCTFSWLILSCVVAENCRLMKLYECQHCIILATLLCNPCFYCIRDKHNLHIQQHSIQALFLTS